MTAALRLRASMLNMNSYALTLLAIWTMVAAYSASLMLVRIYVTAAWFASCLAAATWTGDHRAILTIAYMLMTFYGGNQ